MHKGGIFLIIVLSLLIVGSGAVKTFINESTLCTADVKICDDGTAVGRDSMNKCEFRSCPGEGKNILGDYWLLSLILLSMAGIIDSGYLVLKHYSKKPLRCLMGSKNCSKITESKWAKIFGIRNDHLGLIYYILLLIAIVGLFKGYQIAGYLLWFSIIALVFSLFLVYVQRGILKEYCFFCLISAVINLLIFILFIVR